MGKVFTLTDGIRQIATDSLDDLLDQLGKHCKLVYSPAFLPCAACAADPAGLKPGNAWVSGGPLPLPEGGLCPACGGTGFRAEEVFETITMLVANRPSQFYIPFPANVQVPAGAIQTKFYLSDLGKVRRASQMILQPELSSVAMWRYELEGEPVDVGNIIQGRYCVALWKRA